MTMSGILGAMRWVSPRWSLLVAMGALGALAGLACNGGMVDTTTGNDSGMCPLGSAGCPCLDGGICDDGLLCASKVCIDVGGSTEGSTGSTGGTGSSSSTSASTVGGECSPADDTVNQGCAGSDPTRPYCSKAGLCVDCSGLAACPGDVPACDPESGLCVLCVPGDSDLCSGGTPACDPDTHTCVPCTAHEQCSSGACDLFSGECFDDAEVIWVDSGNKSCGSSGGSEDKPFCSLKQAMVEAVGGDQGAPIVVQIRGDGYDGPIVVPSKRKVAIINPDADIGTVSISASATETLLIESGALAMIDGIELATNDVGSGLRSDGAAVWIDRSVVRNNFKLGLSANLSTVRVRSTVITGNNGGGIDASGEGSFILENSFVTDNGSTKSFVGGLAVSGGADFNAIYSTVISNAATFGLAGSLSCDAPGSVLVRNSVIVGSNDSISCPEAQITGSAVDSSDPGPGNMKIEQSMVADYFLAPFAGIFRVVEGTALAQLATWHDGDPIEDFEGDPRPMDDSSPDYAGADVP